ncbi:MAG: polymer-forming cytoskeletal protein [Balneolaceae bacterium]|nr:polymer-forming cytoskeletal protein [Balneolaceae bacterium]
MIVSGARIEGLFVSPEKNIVIESDTIFHGDINSISLDIRGKVNGNIQASEKVILRRGSEVNGEIHTRDVKIEEGALGTFKIVTKSGA